MVFGFTCRKDKVIMKREQKTQTGAKLDNPIYRLWSFFIYFMEIFMFTHHMRSNLRIQLGNIQLSTRKRTKYFII